MSEVPTQKYLFYKNMPHELLFIENPNKTTAMVRELWGRCGTLRISISDIEEYCNKEDIDKIFFEKCKNAITSNILGWNEEKAIDLENKGRTYLNSQIEPYISRIPDTFISICRNGSYGYVINFSNITLTDSLQMKSRLCSDNQIRKDVLEYIKYILGEEYDLLKIVQTRLPQYKFAYVKYSELRKLQDIWCIAPFAQEIEQIKNSALL